MWPKFHSFPLSCRGGGREKEKQKYNTNVSNKQILHNVQTSNEETNKGAEGKEKKKGWERDEKGLKC